MLSSKRREAPHSQLSYNKRDIKLIFKTLNREVMSGGRKEMNKVRKKEEPGAGEICNQGDSMLGDPVIRSYCPALQSALPAGTLTAPCLPNN